MDDISDLSIEKVEQSRWIKLKKIVYKHNDQLKTSHVLNSHDSCSILVHNIDRDVFIFVRQFRPAAFLQQLKWSEDLEELSATLATSSSLIHNGFTIENCAGILEGDSPRQTAVNEVMEEIGYSIKEEDLCFIAATRNNSLMSGTLGYLFYTRVRDSQRVHDGGGKPEEGEFIEVVEVPVDQALQQIFDDVLQKPVGLTFSLLWFYYTHHNKLPSWTLNDTGTNVSVVDEGSGGGRSRSGCGVESVGGRKSGVEVVSVQDVEASNEFSIYRMHYKQNSVQKSWDYVKSKSYCCVLVHDISKGVFVALREFKPAIYASMCSGNESSMPETADAEVVQLVGDLYEDDVRVVARRCVEEKLGYVAQEHQFEKIINCRTHIGITGVTLSIMYVEVNQDMKKHDPCGDVVELACNFSHNSGKVDDDWMKMAMNPAYPLAFSLSLLWFKNKKCT